MNFSDVNIKEKPQDLMSKVINFIEKVGNKLPHPFLIFLWILIFTFILSAVFNGMSEQIPNTEKVITVKNLISYEGLTFLLKNSVKSFASFSPLGLVMVMMIGLGVTTYSGLLDASMKKLSDIPSKYLVFSVFMIGICGNIASAAASAIVPPLTAALFFSLRKNPIFGLCIGFAAVTAGFTANIFLTGTDILLAGISTSAIKIVGSNIVVQPTSNFYFMFASTLLIAVIGSFVVDKFLMPRFGQWEEKFENCEAAEELKNNSGNKVSDEQVDKGLKKAFWFTVVYWMFMFLMVLIPGGPLRDPVKKTMVPSLFIDGIVILMLLYFILVGIIYGKTTGKIKSIDDIVKGMESGMKSVIGFLVLAFPMAIAIEAFNRSNMASVFAIKTANFLSKNGITGFSLFLVIIAITSITNLFIVSGSTKWALLAPIFIPILYYMGYSPEVSQVLYRIGDSATNIITPMQPFIGLHLMAIRKYDKDAGLGSIFSKTIPLSLVFLVTWILQLLVWYYFNLPLGPGVSYIL